MIAIHDLRHVYAGREVLQIADWSLAKGRAALVLGPSGSGKSTLLHILAGLLAPTAGRVSINGLDLHTLGGGARDRARAQLVGLVFQNLHLVPVVSVRTNVALGARLAGASVKDAMTRADELLARLGLEHRADARPRALSRGEAQRAAIARALGPRPGVLLADEPTAALDDANAAAVVALLREAASENGATMLISTHDGRLRDAFTERLELPGRAA